VFALYTVTLLAFTLAALALFYRHQFSVELEEAQLRAESLSAVIAPTISHSAVIGDYDTIRRTLERAVDHSAFSMAGFIDLKGGVVKAPHNDPPKVHAPAWLDDYVRSRLYDTNTPIRVGGRDYGVLRLTFAPERIAGRLWGQTLIALMLALASVAGGLVLIWFPLARWLGKLGQVQAFEQALARGDTPTALPTGDEAPTEFRQTFEVLGRAAARVQSQRAQAEVTLGAIADGVFTLDAQGTIALVNPAGCAMAALPLDRLLGRSVHEALPDLVARSGDDLRTGRSALEPWAGRRVTLRTGSQGRELVLDTTLSPMKDPAGVTVGHVLACRDMTEQHALDQRLRGELASRETALVSLRQVLEGLAGDTGRETGHVTGHDTGHVAEGSDDLQAISALISDLVTRLKTHDAQLNAIFALSPDGFVSFDSAKRVTYVSPAFEKLTQIEAHSILGRSKHELERLLQARCREEEPWSGFAPMQERARVSAEGDKPARDLIMLARPVRRVLAAGLSLGTDETVQQVFSVRDVTHETEVDQMKTEFLSTAAHELRTPMASIYGSAELLLHRQMKPERQRELIVTIHRQSQLLVAIVNELLDLARIEARRGQDFEIETLDLASLVTEIVGDFKPPAGRESPALQVPEDHASAPVRVDRNKLRQALGNVLSNAYKYSPDGGAVDLELVHERGRAGVPAWVGVRVRDHGIGMTPEQLARVSERFYRADSSGNIPGTGLGMSLVKEIVELLGGRLVLDSTAGQGTTVTVWLPGSEPGTVDSSLSALEAA
jgi:PAS domain S-box-containing protein